MIKQTVAKKATVCFFIHFLTILEYDFYIQLPTILIRFVDKPSSSTPYPSIFNFSANCCIISGRTLHTFLS